MKCFYLLGVVTCVLGVGNTKAHNSIVEDHVEAVKNSGGDVGMREHAKEVSQQALQSFAQLETHQGSGVYQFTGIPRDPTRNFCRSIVSSLHDRGTLLDDGRRKYGHKTNVSACADVGTETECPESYVRHDRGEFYSCRWTGSECTNGYLHTCTWTYLMEDLVQRQTSHTSACHGHMLEAKRSLDGLLYDAESILRRIRIQNERIYAQNITIRDLLNDQRNYWTTYMQQQDACWTTADTNTSIIRGFDGELDQLSALITVIRSDVGMQRDSQYGQNEDDTQLRGVGNNPDITEADRLTQAPSPAPENPWDTGNEHLSSFAEMEAASCAKFKDLVMKYMSTSPTKTSLGEHIILGPTPSKWENVVFENLDCHEEREYLQYLVNQTVREIRELKREQRQDIANEYSECMSEATYVYKFAVESRDCSTGPCVDRRIQLAALEIHDAQNVISTWEPRLHDVEHAAERLRSYLVQLNNTCVLDDNVRTELHEVQTKIRELAECPGRNDFTLTVPHWIQPPGSHTPSPTPWFERWSPGEANPDHPEHLTQGQAFGNQDLDRQINAPVRPTEHQTIPDVTSYQ